MSSINQSCAAIRSTNLSLKITSRFYKYYSLKQLDLRKTTIHNALLKYGFKNFRLEILEYCAEGVNPVEREQYFLDLLNPEYNILNKAGSLLGFKHKTETLEFFLRMSGK